MTQQFWTFILERLSRKQPVVLLCVLDSKGSSPGRQGYKMAVADDGMSGSIGGGIMEHKFAEMAKEKLRAIPKNPQIRKQVHSKEATQNRSGMICSGEQTIVLFHLTDAHSSAVKSINDSLHGGGGGNLMITPDNFSFSPATMDGDFSFLMKDETDWSYQEKVGFKNKLYIVGGGHCSLAFSKLMSGMDFEIHLFENRKDLNTLEQNTYVHTKTIVDDYAELKDRIPPGSDTYVVIMTFGYRTDDEAYRSLYKSDYKYIGLLGSKSKIQKMREEWKSAGIPDERTKLLHAPIGLSINSRTPEEIAISIAAEIIGVKNQAV